MIADIICDCICGAILGYETNQYAALRNELYECLYELEKVIMAPGSRSSLVSLYYYIIFYLPCNTKTKTHEMVVDPGNSFPGFFVVQKR